MKTIIGLMHIVVWCLFVLISQGCSTRVASMLAFGAQHVSKAVHFVTVDDHGNPLSGVRVKMSWTIEEGKSKGDKGEAIFVSDSEGRFCTPEDFSPIAIMHTVDKAGYRLESYMNLNVRGPYPYQLYTKERPFKLVFRKVGQEKAVTVYTSGDRYRVNRVKRGEKGDPAPLWVVSDVNRDHHKEADCFALPEFDEEKKTWMCKFWTTNVNGGVLATTNRVFVAPETGYQKCITVPLEMCQDPSFTLYVKTYNPLLYAMFWVHGYGSESKYAQQLPTWSSHYCGGSTRPTPDKPYGTLQVEESLYNPFGDRVLEDDDQKPPFLEEELLPVLMQGRYPPRPDIPARVDNFRKRFEALRLWQNKRNELEDMEKRRDELAKKGETSRSELDALNRQIKLGTEEARKYHRELRRLEAEAPKLNLPK